MRPSKSFLHALASVTRRQVPHVLMRPSKSFAATILLLVPDGTTKRRVPHVLMRPSNLYPRRITMYSTRMNKESLLKKGLLLEYITFGWNVFGSAIALWAGIQAASLALFGFGIDSVIEIFASVVVVWQLKATHQKNEKFALKLVGSAFLLLSLFLLVRAVQVLLGHVHPEPSTLGAVWLFVTAITMFLLAYGKRKIGKQIPHAVLVEESIVTLIDGFLAVAILAGVLLNTFLGWWWADALASLVLAFLGAREAVHIFNGEHS